MIDVKDLHKRFGEVEALHGVNFCVQRHEILGFLGPNAAGKTTTMRILTGFLSPDEGSVSVAGYHIPGQSMDVRRSIGYLPENVTLYTEMTARAFLEYMAALKEVPKERRHAALDSVIERCEIGSVQHRLIKGLSKGYRQRIGLAQAIVHDPKVVILDEPTVGLDPKQIHEVRKLIKELGRDHTVILCSHILSEVGATCDRIAIIHQGTVVAQDTTQGLISRMEGALPVKLEVRGPEDDVRAFLNALQNTELVTLTADDQGINVAELRIPAEPLFRERLVQAIVEQGWGLRSLLPSGTSLEDVFLELTREERQ